MRNLSYFAWRTGRGAACLQDIVPPQFSGITQCNGHSAYEAFGKSPAHAGKIKLAGCLAHARRKFFEACAEGEGPSGCSHRCSNSTGSKKNYAKPGPAPTVRVPA